MIVVMVPPKVTCGQGHGQALRLQGLGQQQFISLLSSHLTSKIALGMDVTWQMGEGEGAHLHGGLGQSLGVLKEVFITFAHIVLPGSQTHGREVEKCSCIPRSCVG